MRGIASHTVLVFVLCSVALAADVPVKGSPGHASRLALTGDPSAPSRTAAERPLSADSDGDGVNDDRDVCPDTVIPEALPTRRHGVNRFALVDGDGIFDTTAPPGGGGDPGLSFTVEETAGCSCEQIILALGLGSRQTKFGCSASAMEAFVALLNPWSYPLATPTQRAGTVMIDQAHNNFHTAGGTYAPFARLLRDHGYTVVESSSSFSRNVLDKGQVLVISNALADRNADGDWSLPTPSAFTDDEITAVYEWVEDGGSLLLIADHMPFPGAAEKLAASFGIEFNNGFAFDPNRHSKPVRCLSGDQIQIFQRSDGSLRDHATTNGRKTAERIGSVGTFTGQAFEVDSETIPLLVFGASAVSLMPEVAWRFPPSTPRISVAGWSQGAAKKVGSGRLAVFGEAAMFSEQSCLSFPMGMNAPEAAENAQFTLNLVRWLFAEPNTTGTIDHFMCYKAKITKSTSRFQAIRGLNLADQFETAAFDVIKPAALCAPTDKNHEGILDSETHLESYKIKRASGQPEQSRQTNIRVENQFGVIVVDTVKPDRLLVPTARDLSESPLPPDPAEHNVDHLKCYKVKVRSGFQKGLQAFVADQFSPSRQYDIKKPSRLCAPVDKEGEGIKDETNHLMCYRVKSVKGSPRHERVTGIRLNNQFGPLQMDTVKEQELCLPSSRTVD